jgi:hypothetical protein
METTTKLSKDVMKLALIILNRHRQTFIDYEESAAEYAKQGYRPHYCVHGVNMWVDYDCACGMCEEYGGYWHYDTYARFAIDEAKAAHAEQLERIDMLVKMHSKGAPMSIAELGAWATEPVQKYYPKADQRVGYAALSKVDPPF